MNESGREPAAEDEQTASSAQHTAPSDDQPEATGANASGGDASAAPASANAASAEETADPTAVAAEAISDRNDDDASVDDTSEIPDEMYSGDEDAAPVALYDDEDEGDEDAQPVALGEEGAEEENEEMKWYILKVQSNREDSIRDALLRRMKIAGLEHFVSRVIVPKESITEYKNGRKRVRKTKIYPGYIVVHMVINDETWFLVRETPGIGDFTGAAGKPSPMLQSEVDRILELEKPEEDKRDEKLKVTYAIGELVKVTEGNFENMEGQVEAVDATNQRITVLIQIFGRPTPVELQYWQVQSVQ